jgi:hypothetical protein
MSDVGRATQPPLRPIRRVDGYLPIEDHGLVGDGPRMRSGRPRHRHHVDVRPSVRLATAPVGPVRRRAGWGAEAGYSFLLTRGRDWRRRLRAGSASSCARSVCWPATWSCTPSVQVRGGAAMGSAGGGLRLRPRAGPDRDVYLLADPRPARSSASVDRPRRRHRHRHPARDRGMDTASRRSGVVMGRCASQRGQQRCRRSPRPRPPAC